MNKKGFVSDSEQLITWAFLALPALVLIGALFFLLGQSYESQKAAFPEDTQYNVLTTRILYTPECYAHQTRQGRTLVGVISQESISDTTLNDCIQTTDLDVGVFTRLFVDNEPVAEAKTEGWDSIPSQDRYVADKIVSVDTNTLGVLRVRYK